VSGSDLSRERFDAALPAIRRVLAQYRSTQGHITEAEITAAWSEYDGLTQRSVTQIGLSGEWPVAVSDGIDLPCVDCGEIPSFDYRVTDEFWQHHVRDEGRLGVVCLPCLDRRCAGVGVAEALVFVQFTGIGHTVVLHPVERFEYGGRR
jgi:hypothetical protein